MFELTAQRMIYWKWNGGLPIYRVVL